MFPQWVSNFDTTTKFEVNANQGLREILESRYILRLQENKDFSPIAVGHPAHSQNKDAVFSVGDSAWTPELA
jgi:hypothetical protein